MAKEKKLKTLEDIEYIEYSKDLGDHQISVERYNKKIKEAAKEWVEELKKNPKEWSCGDNLPNVCETLPEWIKHFFNLGEKND